MNIKIEVKIKLDKKGIVTLNSDEAKELYLKLKDIYEPRLNYITYPYTWTADTVTYPVDKVVITSNC
jgi:hypothetical protein